MKIFLHNRKDIQVFQGDKPLKIYCQNGSEYVLPKVSEEGYYSVEFVKKSEFAGGLWLLRAFLFWIIGIMGFFTPKYAKCTHSLNCRVSGVASDTPLNVNFLHPNPKYGVGVGVKVREADSCVIEGAEYVADSKAKGRKKLYAFLSAILRLAVIVLAVVIIIKAIVG